MLEHQRAGPVDSVQTLPVPVCTLRVLNGQPVIVNATTFQGFYCENSINAVQGSLCYGVVPSLSSRIFVLFPLFLFLLMGTLFIGKVSDDSKCRTRYIVIGSEVMLSKALVRIVSQLHSINKWQRGQARPNAESAG